MDICDTCIDISKRNARMDKGARYSKQLERRVQCSECGSWWEWVYINTRRYYWSNKKWMTVSFGWGARGYVPMGCTQRRCMAHARHKVATKGKRKWKCDRHAGVCIIV